MRNWIYVVPNSVVRKQAYYRVSQQVPDRDLKKWQKKSVKVCLHFSKAMQIALQFDKKIFHQKKIKISWKKSLGHPVVLQERSRARVNCFRKEQKFLTFLYFSAFSQNCWKERRKERREEETGVNNGPSFSKSTWWISTEFLWSKFLLLLLSAAYY